MISLNFANVQSREPLEEGTYQVIVEKAEEKVSQAGNNMIALTFKVTSDDPKYNGRKLFANYVITEKCMWKVKELTDAAGIESGDTLELDAQDLVGASMIAKVTQEEYNGNTVNRVARVFAF